MGWSGVGGGIWGREEEFGAWELFQSGRKGEREGGGGVLGGEIRSWELFWRRREREGWTGGGSWSDRRFGLVKTMDLLGAKDRPLAIRK